MITRKRFLAVAGVSAGTLVAACGGEDDDERQREARAAADREIVRHLLRVERVTSAFWTEVITRAALADVPEATDLAREIARNEREHVSTLERYARRLAGDAGTPPGTRFAEVFAAGPQEVLGTGATLANLSAAAHLGQANRIQDRNLLASVLAIHSVDGRQAAATNRLAGRGFTAEPLEGSLPDGAFAEPMTMRDVEVRLRRYVA